MKLTTKNLLIILVVLMAALAVSQLTKRTGRSKSLRSELVAIDTSQVSKIIITSGNDEVMLTIGEESWYVGSADGTQKQAKSDAVTGLLSSLNSIQPGRLAARSKDKWRDYQVDSAGTRVRVYEADALATDIVIGRFGVEGQQSFYTFVRLFEDEEVYVAPNFMGISIGKDAAAYRDNLIVRLQKDSLTGITFNYPDSAFQLTQQDAWYVADQPADSAAVAGYLSGLTFVNSKQFYDQDLPEGPIHSVSFAFSNRPDIVIDAYPSSQGLVVNSSENVSEYFLDRDVIDKIFRGQSAFLTTSN